jgi:integrase
MPPGAPRLLDQVRSRIRVKHYSIRTEEAYVDWIRRYIRFHRNRHPVDLSATDVEEFLTRLATDRGVAASTQNQAKSALIFLYRDLLAIELPWLDGIVRAKTPSRLPVVLTRAETAALLVALCGTHRLVGELLYGTGMRILEALRLRVKDVDFVRRKIVIRNLKGAKDRVTMLSIATVDGSANQYHRAPPRQRPIVPARNARGAAHVGNRQARDTAYASTFVRYAFARGRERHPHRAGAPGALGCEHDDDLHARVESRWTRCRKSARSSRRRDESAGRAVRVLRNTARTSGEVRRPAVASMFDSASNAIRRGIARTIATSAALILIV